MTFPPFPKLRSRSPFAACVTRPPHSANSAATQIKIHKTRRCHRDAFDHSTCLRRKNMIRLPVFGYLAAPGVLGNEKTNAIAARCTVVPAIKLRYFSGEDCCGRRAEASL